MSLKQRGKTLLGLVMILALLWMVAVACQPQAQVEIQPMGVTNLSSLHLSDTAATATPILMMDGPTGNAGNLIEARVASTPVWYINASGAQAQTGVSYAPDGSASAPAYSFSADTDSGIYRIGTNNVGVAVSATLISDWSSSSLDMNSLPVVNIGAAGTDFGSDGSLTTAQTITVTAGGLVVTAGGATITAGGLDMTNDPITNIGAAGTDFGSDGSLTTAQTITVTAGGLVVTAGGATITAGGLDMTNDPITNIGAAGTDFGSDGSLTTALTITITSGGLTVSAGGANVTGSINGSADVDVGTWLNLSAQSTLAIAEGETITPTGTYQVITSTVAITTSTTTAIADGGETGDVLILRNGNAADSIIIDGTGANVECKTDVTLGASDTLTLIWNGSDWNCLAGYDNS